MRLFPLTEPRPTHSHAERALYAALAKVPMPWSCFHSLRLRSREGWEGEGDFVLADPNGGILVLEVKGGQLELRNGQWTQNGRGLERAPRDQALGFVKNLIGELKKSGCETPPFGVACVFPDSEFSAGPSNGDLRGLVLGKRDLPYLKDVLPEVFKLAVPPGRVPQSRKWLEQLRTLWGETWVPSVSLADRLEDSEERTVALDAKQYQLLEVAGETPRALVEGAAGSGKTLIATELCRRRAASGLAPLYLCFTDALAQAVQSRLTQVPGARALTVRQLAVELLRKAGATIPAQTKAFWDEVSLNAACEALPPESERPGIVIVDEGQDLEPSDWMLVEQLAGPRGLWVFRDQRQAFWSDRALPEALGKSLGGRFTLPRSYRCPQALAEYAEALVAGRPAHKPPDDVLKLVESRGDEVVATVRREVEVLLKAGAKPEQIVVVSLSGQTKSALWGLKSLGALKVAHADAPEASKCLVVETFLRFKGLERPFVVIAETDGKHVTHREVRLHIALTRATTGATLIAEGAHDSTADWGHSTHGKLS